MFDLVQVQVLFLGEYIMEFDLEAQTAELWRVEN